jgi:hypothetical protein
MAIGEDTLALCDTPREGCAGLICHSFPDAHSRLLNRTIIASTPASSVRLAQIQ